MRQLALTVHPHDTKAVLDAAEQHDISLFAQVDAVRGSDKYQLLILEAPNAKIEDFLKATEKQDGLRAAFAPQGIISLRPPADETEEQMVDILPRSPLEVFLGALQSIGSWPGFLGYSVIGGIIVWIGLYTENVFLLVAAMLIAPFAGPAMTLAIATARGDRMLLVRSLGRYFAALAVSIATAFALSIALDQQFATQLMVQTSMRSSVSVLLPLAAGFAGALNLVQSERSSLVSGAATGMLVAAALAPPAGLVGMGLAIGEMDIVVSSLWALAIQIVGINLAGFVVFRLYGLKNEGARYPRGQSILSYASLGASFVALAVLVAVQFMQVPQFQQSSVALRISASVQQQLQDVDGVQPVSVQSHFTRNRASGENPVWVTVRIEADMSDDAQKVLARRLQNLVEREYGVKALVDVTAIY